MACGAGTPNCREMLPHQRCSLGDDNGKDVTTISGTGSRQPCDRDLIVDGHENRRVDGHEPDRWRRGLVALGHTGSQRTTRRAVAPVRQRRGAGPAGRRPTGVASQPRTDAGVGSRRAPFPEPGVVSGHPPRRGHDHDLSRGRPPGGSRCRRNGRQQTVEQRHPGPSAYAAAASRPTLHAVRIRTAVAVVGSRDHRPHPRRVSTASRDEPLPATDHDPDIPS